MIQDQVYGAQVGIRSWPRVAPPIRFALQPGKARLWEQVLVAVWFTVISFEFTGSALVRYPLAAIFAVSSIAYRREILATARRGPIVFVLPALALASALWSAVPLDSAYFGTLMILSMVVCIYIATRLDSRQVMMVFLMASLVLCVMSFANPNFYKVGNGELAASGVFAQKNGLGKRMLMLLAVASLIAVDARFSVPRRVLAIAALLPAGVLVVRSNSATALLLGIGLSTLVIGLSAVWQPSGRVRGLRLLIVAAVISLSAVGGLVICDVLWINPYKAVLKATGKDPTLTGRTVLWEAATEVIPKDPILGVGAGAFWRPGSDEAQILLRRFHKTDRFSFHDGYFEATVALGFVGLTIFVATFAWGLYVVIRDWLRYSDSTSNFLVVVAAYTVLNSITESELFSALQLGPMLFWVGVFLAVTRREAAQRVSPVVHGRR